MSLALTHVSVKSQEPSGPQWNQNPAFLGKAAPEDPREHSELHSSKDPKRPLPAHWLSTKNQFSRLFSRSRRFLTPLSGHRPPLLPNFPTSHLLPLGPRHNWEAAGAGRDVQQLKLWTHYPCAS